MKFAATTFLLGICLATPATPAEITRHQQQVDGSDAIKISGLIEPDDDTKFAAIASGINEATIVLNSVGGNNNAAGHIGSFIRLHNYETRVHNGAICNSACVLIWIAGSFRHLDRYARLGVHSAGTETGPTGKRHEEANKIIAVYLEHMGAPQEMIDLWPVADPCCINYIDYAQAKNWGLLSERPAKQATTSPKPERRPRNPLPAGSPVRAGAGAEVPTQYRGLWCSVPGTNAEQEQYHRCRQANGEDSLNIRRDHINLIEVSDCGVDTITPIVKGHRLLAICDGGAPQMFEVDLRLDRRTARLMLTRRDKTADFQKLMEAIKAISDYLKDSGSR